MEQFTLDSMKGNGYTRAERASITLGDTTVELFRLQGEPVEVWVKCFFSQRRVHTNLTLEQAVEEGNKLLLDPSSRW